MNNTTTDTFTKTIWASHKEIFLKKLKHLNKILAKNGKEPIKVSFKNFRSVTINFTIHEKGDAFANDQIIPRSVELCDAVCSGYVNVGKSDSNYIFLGTVSFENGVKQVFCKDENFTNYFSKDFREGFCDHCKSSRSNRKSYFLFLKESSGEVLQIGSKCAKEFFGISSTNFLETYGSTFLLAYAGDSEDFSNFSKNCLTVDFKTLAPLVDYATNGFLKWNKSSLSFFPEFPAYENPTVPVLRNLINSIFNGSLDDDDSIVSKNTEILSYDDVLSFWTNKYAKDDDAFSYNCLEAVKSGYATNISLGTFAYAIFAAYNNKVREIREKEIASQAKIVPCSHPEGKRCDIVGIVTNIRSFVVDDFAYNGFPQYETVKYIVDFTEENGTLYHFTTSAQSFSNIKNGDRLSIRCTINETKPYKGIPYTRVSRPVASIINQDS